MEGECVICKGPFSLLYGGKELYDSLTCNHLLMANFSLYFYASVAPILMLALTLIKRSYNKYGNRASNRGSPKFQNHEEWPYYVLIDSMLRIYANQTACHFWPLHRHPNFTSSYHKFQNSALNVTVLVGTCNQQKPFSLIVKSWANLRLKLYKEQ